MALDPSTSVLSVYLISAIWDGTDILPELPVLPESRRQRHISGEGTWQNSPAQTK